MEAAISYDRADFIATSIDNVYKTIAEAVVLVVLIIFLFLRSLRATIIPLVTIPVSLIGACAMMLALGFSIKQLTLLSLEIRKSVGEGKSVSVRVDSGGYRLIKKKKTK